MCGDSSFSIDTNNILINVFVKIELQWNGTLNTQLVIYLWCLYIISIHFFLLSFWFCLLEWLSMWYLSNDPFTSQKQTSRFIYCTKRQKYTACVQVRETWNKSEMGFLLIFYFEIWIDSFLYIFLWYTFLVFVNIMCSFISHALCASGEKKKLSTTHFNSWLLIYIKLYIKVVS